MSMSACPDCGSPGAAGMYNDWHAYWCPRYRGPGPKPPKTPRKKSVRKSKSIQPGQRVISTGRLRIGWHSHERGTVISFSSGYYRVQFDNGTTSEVRADLIKVTE